MQGNEALADDDRKTSSQILKEIRDAKRQLVKKDEPAATASNSEEVKIVETKDKPKEQTEAVSTSVELPAPAGEAPKTEEVKGETEKAVVPDVVKKKGWKDVDEFLKSYQELERKFHDKKKEDKVVTPMAYIPPQQQQQDSFQYPVNIRQQVGPIDNIARQYGLAPEDVERIAPFVADLAEVIANKKVESVAGELQRLNQSMTRRFEEEQLKQDPVFKNPEVLSEIERILESNPRIMEEKSAPLAYAYDEAVKNIGRRNILLGSKESKTESSTSSGSGLPGKPPVTAGGGGGESGKTGNVVLGRIDHATFSSLPLAEKQKVLKQLRAFKTED